jgi:ATP/maltotriose-dependent transcriptional regulator MalT
LVASWLDARKLRGIWYQIDAGDADVGSFFLYLALGVAPFTSGRAPLPMFAPEYRQDLVGFARRYFRALSARLPADSMIVLDNVQEAAHAPALYDVLAVAVHELPGNANLVAISREQPPEAFARLSANRLLSIVDWDDLRLTLRETESIAGTHLLSLGMNAKQLHEQCQGWVAGLTLMLERAKHADKIETMDSPDTREAIFRYFAGQIFTVATGNEQRFLIRSAFLPRTTVAMAAALTGDPLAGERLKSLHRRQLFTHRQEGKEPSYVYHALFRSFLLSQAATQMSHDEQAELWARSGAILEMSSEFEDAVDAYARGDKWDALTSLVRRTASDLLSQGRAPTLRAWIDRMPRERVEKSAWLEYWLASATAPEDAMGSIRGFQRAYDLFVENGEVDGQVHALCGLIEAVFFAATDHAMMDPSIPILKEVMLRIEHFSSNELELRAYAAMLIATLFRQPNPQELARIAQRTLELLDSDAPTNQRMRGAIFLMVYCIHRSLHPVFSGHSQGGRNRILWRRYAAESRYMGSLEVLPTPNTLRRGRRDQRVSRGSGDRRGARPLSHHLSVALLPLWHRGQGW